MHHKILLTLLKYIKYSTNFLREHTYFGLSHQKLRQSPSNRLFASAFTTTWSILHTEEWAFKNVGQMEWLLLRTEQWFPMSLEENTRLCNALQGPMWPGHPWLCPPSSFHSHSSRYFGFLAALCTCQANMQLRPSALFFCLECFAPRYLLAWNLYFFKIPLGCDIFSDFPCVWWSWKF